MGIDQTPDGFLWVATQTGVVRFDGVKFQHVTVKKSGVDGGMNQALCVDQRGRVWVGMQSGMIVCLEQGKVSVMHHPEDDGTRQRVRSLVVDGEGVVWASLINSTILRIKEGKARAYKEADGLPHGVPELTVDQSGQLWVLNDSQLGVFREERFCRLGTCDFQRICKASSGGVNLSSDTKLSRFTVAEGFSEHVALPAGLLKAGMTSLLEDRAGRVWIGTRLAGLYCYDGKSIEKVETSHQTILCLSEDREGNVWVGTRGGGLQQVRPRVVELRTIGTAMSYRGIQSICKDTHGVLWAITWHRGAIFRYSNNEWLPLTTLNGWTGREVKCVAADPAGGVWIGSETEGVYAWRDGGIGQHLSLSNGLKGMRVTALKVTGQEDVWIGVNSLKSKEAFLQKWKAGTFQTYRLPPNSVSVPAIEEDVAGDCWVATTQGVLLRIQKGSSSCEPQTLLQEPCQIRSLLATPDGSLWIAFAGMGLGRLKDGVFSHVTMEQGLYDDYISHILSDGRGRLWLAGNRGIFSVREQELNSLVAGRIKQVQSVVYKQKDGLSGLQASYDAFPGAFRDQEGRLFFAMQSGVATVYPDACQEDGVAPRVVVERILANGRVVSRGGACETLSPRERQVEFVFTAPYFTMPESVRFRTRLQGLEREWSEAGSRRSVLYSQLAPGQYQFQVMACNKDGVWSKSASSSPVTIRSFWWETTLFHFGAPLLGFVVLGGVVLLWFRRHYQFQIEKLELQRAMEKERARIAADLHDEIGANLTHISILSTLAAKPEAERETSRQQNAEVTSVARQTILAFDEILWSVNPKNDTLKSLSHYICRRTEEILAPAKIMHHFSLDEALPDTPMSPQRRHGLLLAVKEALHNILKHAGATRVEVACVVENGEFVVSVSDNGCGFDPSAIPVNGKGRRGQGLENMRRRLKELGGACGIERQPEGGTRIIFRLPIE
jgi:signal transduction histidine kinase/ligand-binding sensor domain-containing protein